RGRDIDSMLADSYGMPRGIYVAGTTAGGGAEAAGILEGDIIVGMDNVSFTTMSELQEQLSRHEPGDTVTLIIMREIDGSYSQVKVEVTLTEPIS
ncbi:MAG: PDZ domain-containing protein, partial [Lachnospiraceae bacterium]|nr:PDZ domain-containing protein [Lachnospiraceae bacterium]